ERRTLAFGGDGGMSQGLPRKCLGVLVRKRRNSVAPAFPGDPDLLITDDKKPGMNGEEICQRLLDRRSAYPIIVDFGWPPTEQWVRDCASRGLKIQFLRRPFLLEDFRKVLEGSLKPPRSDDRGS